LPHEGDDLAGDIAAIERVARSFEPGLTAPRGRGTLLVGHVLQRRREVGLPEDFPNVGHPTVWQKDRCSRRPGAMISLVPLQALGHQRIHRKAVARQPDRRRRNLAKAHRAVPPERRNPRVGRGGNHRSQHTLWNLAGVLALEQLRIERLRPGPETGDRHHLLLVGEVNHNRRNTGDIDQIALEHTERDPGSTTGIDGVAASLQDVKTRGGGEIMARRDRMLRYRDGRPMRR